MDAIYNLPNTTDKVNKKPTIENDSMMGHPSYVGFSDLHHLMSVTLCNIN